MKRVALAVMVSLALLFSQSPALAKSAGSTLTLNTPQPYAYGDTVSFSWSSSELRGNEFASVIAECVPDEVGHLITLGIVPFPFGVESSNGGFTLAAPDFRGWFSGAADCTFTLRGTRNGHKNQDGVSRDLASVSFHVNP